MNFSFFDLSREAKNAAKQLMLLFADNRAQEDPFDLHFCNANFEKETMKSLSKLIPPIRDASFPINVHEESYLDLFPKEKLVYLTPHCNTDLVEFNPDDIYIVGAMVDKMNNEPISLARAKNQQLRMARLPLDKYLQWGAGSGKSLTINQMLSILYDCNKTRDWNYALRHVPRRKLVHHEAMEQKLSRFKEHRFNFETWGATRLQEHSAKRVEKRLKPNFRVGEVLDLKKDD